MTTKNGGPSWDKVYRRITVNTGNNEIIEDLHVDPNTDNKILHRALPRNVSQTKTTLFYHDTYENLQNGNKDDQNINVSYNTNSNSYWQQQYDTPFSFSLHTTIDEYLGSLAYDELIGYHTAFETYAYTITTIATPRRITTQTCLETTGDHKENP